MENFPRSTYVLLVFRFPLYTDIIQYFDQTILNKFSDVIVRTMTGSAVTTQRIEGSALATFAMNGNGWIAAKWLIVIKPELGGRNGERCRSYYPQKDRYNLKQPNLFEVKNIKFSKCWKMFCYEHWQFMWSPNLSVSLYL